MSAKHSHIVPFASRPRPPRRRRFRRLDEYPPVSLPPAQQAEVDRLLLEDKVARLIERVPERLLGKLLYMMDEDDLVLLDLVAQGISFSHDTDDDPDRTARIRRAANRSAARQKGRAR